MNKITIKLKNDCNHFLPLFLRIEMIVITQDSKRKKESGRRKKKAAFFLETEILKRKFPQNDHNHFIINLDLFKMITIMIIII